MATRTPNYDLIKPAVNDPTDQDLWGGMLNENFDILDSVIKAVSDSVAAQVTIAVRDTVYPVGSLYTSFTDSRDPNVILGFGTWTKIEGRSLIGQGTGTDVNGFSMTFNILSTGGEYRHTQTIAQMPSHNHTFPTRDSNQNGGLVEMADTNGAGNTVTTSSSGGGNPMQWLHPYITAYMWRRTA